MKTPWLQQASLLFQSGLDLLFPSRCVGCQRGGMLLCPSCLRTMRPAPMYCQRCGIPLTSSNTRCTFCQYNTIHLHGLRCVNLHQTALRKAIHALKYQGQQRLAEPLGNLLAEAFIRYDLRADALIPLPLHTQRERQRGFNQATLLTRVCATHLKVPCLEECIIRQRATDPQVGLNAQQRRQNVSGAFALMPDAKSRLLAYKRVVVIDDVCTTGATLDACAAPLYQAGIAEVWGLVLARPDNLVQDATQGML